MKLCTEERVYCVFNHGHIIPKSKIIKHHQTCPDRYEQLSEFMECPYNPAHLIKGDDYQVHVESCPDEPNFKVNLDEYSNVTKKFVYFIIKEKKLNPVELDEFEDKDISDGYNINSSKAKIQDCTRKMNFAY